MNNNIHDKAHTIRQKDTMLLLLLYFALILHTLGLKISKCKNVCPEWLRWGLGNCERVGKANCVETLNCHVNTLVQERSFPRIGCAKRGSSADFCYEAVSFVWQGTKTKSLYRHQKKKHVSGRERTVLGRLSRGRGRCSTSCHVAHFATRRMVLVCEQLSHHTWHCVPTAMAPASSHRVSFRCLCRDPAAP